LELCEGNGERLGRDLLLQIAQELQHPDPNLVVNAGTEILAQLRQLDIIYGVPAAS
jgi:aspartate/glutamate racemase